MQRVTMEFEMPEDSESYDMAYHAADFWEVIHDMDQWLRRLVKYENPKDIETLEGVRQQLWLFINDQGVNRFF